MPENPNTNLHDLILANGWEQGSLTVLSVFGIEEEPNTVLIAVTQTCDLANSSLEKEPEVEFVKAQIVSEKNQTTRTSKVLDVYRYIATEKFTKLI